jgi:hypothetical protein
MATNLTPVETRAQDPTFVARCSLNGLRDRLPLRLLAARLPDQDRPVFGHFG